MSGDSVPTTAGHSAIGLVQPAGDSSLSVHLQAMISAKTSLEHDLRQCHEQLNLVFAITEQMSGLRDSDQIEQTLLQHYGTLLRAGAVFIDGDGCCTRAEPQGQDGVPVDVPAEQLRVVLGEHIEATRKGRRPRVVQDIPELGQGHALLGALARADDEYSVVVALRHGSERPFDQSDVLASESVLVYGAQILRNVAHVRRLQQAALETVCALVNAIDAKDNYTSDHSERVGVLARMTGEALGLSKQRLQALEWAGLLHDVGKIGVPEQILNKPGRLTDAEFAQMKKHPRIGYEMLKPVGRLEPVLDVVLYHHENHDGSGYPERLRGTQIPLEAQIIHVVDVFDALTTSRPYRSSFGLDHALRLLEQDAGRVTDKRITQVFIDVLRQDQARDPAGFRTRFAHLVGE